MLPRPGAAARIEGTAAAAQDTNAIPAGAFRRAARTDRPLVRSQATSHDEPAPQGPTAMPTTIPTLSDKALAVFAFAAYHQLESGQRVASVVQRDGAGHQADGEAVAELRERGLAEADGGTISFTPDGEAVLERVIGGLREAANG
jgi:hypothetical protein